jgi:hypothetical protein
MSSPEAQVYATAVAADGTTHDIGRLQLTDTVFAVKQKLATVSAMAAECQSLFLIHDKRKEVDAFELQNDEQLCDIRDYAAPTAILEFSVMVGISRSNATDFVKRLEPEPSVQFGDGTKEADIEAEAAALGIHGEHGGPGIYELANVLREQLKKSELFAVAFIPAHPELIVVTAGQSHQVQLYNSTTGELVFSMGTRDGSRSNREGTFNGPWGVAVSSDSTHIVTSDMNNNRLQVLKLDVECSLTDGDQKITKASLEFVRFIGAGRGGGGGAAEEPEGANSEATTRKRRRDVAGCR